MHSNPDPADLQPLLPLREGPPRPAPQPRRDEAGLRPSTPATAASSRPQRPRSECNLRGSIWGSGSLLQHEDTWPGLKCVWNNKRPRIATAIPRKENEAGGVTPPDSNYVTKPRSSERHGTGTRANRAEQRATEGNKPALCARPICDRGARNIRRGRTSL